VVVRACPVGAPFVDPRCGPLVMIVGHDVVQPERPV
jgi:hypothetical protein